MVHAVMVGLLIASVALNCFMLWRWRFALNGWIRALDERDEYIQELVTSLVHAE